MAALCKQQTDTLAAFATQLTKLSRPLAARYFRQNPDIEQKADTSPVTEADKAIEQALRQAISNAWPEHGIIGEEQHDKTGSSSLTWVLDPIDGTRSFACGNPLFGTLIALLDDGAPLIGIIDLPLLDQCWVGVSGRSTLLNGKPAASSGLSSLAAARLVTTSSAALGQQGWARFQHLASAVSVVNYGGDCSSYGFLASGWCDLVVERNLQPHDAMALVPVLTGSGAACIQWDGTEPRLDSFDGSLIAAASQPLAEAAAARLDAARI